MKKQIQWLFIAIMYASMCACSSEDAIQSSQVEDSSVVSFTFFDATMEEFGSATRADDTKTETWKDYFKRLDIAIFPAEGAKIDTVYRFHQLASDASFGSISIRLPFAKYSMVAIASKITDEVDILSPELASFPDSATVNDMAYVYKDLDVKGGSMSANCVLSRAITKLVFASNDLSNVNISKVEFKYVGKLGASFNPKTGFGINSDKDKTISKTFSLANIDRTKTIAFTLFSFIPKETLSINVDFSVYDTSGKILKTMHFDDVTLQQNHVTTYTGPMFTSGSTFGFSFDDKPLTKSDYDKEFGD